MGSRPVYRDIAGAEGREPVGAVLTIGEKGPRGAPVNTDRFYLRYPVEDKGVRPRHPDFRFYNESTDIGLVSIMRGNLVHASLRDVGSWSLRAQVIPGLNPPPSRRPMCSGDGVSATRFFGILENGEGEDWRQIQCPNEACEFRQGPKKACGAAGTLYFRPRWRKEGLPVPLVRWTTGGWHSALSIRGLVEYVESQARDLGLSTYTVMGLPFVLLLGKKTMPKLSRSFPVVSISVDCDLQAFLLAQRAALESVGLEARPRLALPPVTVEDEQASIDADHLQIRPGIIDHAGDQPSASQGGLFEGEGNS